MLETSTDLCVSEKDLCTFGRDLADGQMKIAPEEIVRPWVEIQRSVRRLRERWGLQGTRKQKHTMETIHDAVQEIRKRYPNMGARGMAVHLRQKYEMRVPEKLILEYFRMVEPDSVRRRKGKRFKRKQYWTAGLNDVWCFDQHDKWLRFGLFLHLGFEPCAGRILYIKIWWTNHNPRLITSYYLEAARAIGGVPLVTQSDPGSENFGIANCHTEIRHELDGSLSDTLQHRWMRNKTNIKPEIVWAVLRRGWTPGFEDILDRGRLEGLYDPNEPLEKLVFLWVVVPWLQGELDAWVHQFNTSPRRADKNKVLPQGIPDVITAKPGRYNTLDFKVGVPEDLFNRMTERWAPPDHAVFQLVPPVFNQLISETYARIGSPVVTSDTVWQVYQQLLASIRNMPQVPDMHEELATRSAAEAEEVALLAGLRDLRHGAEAPNVNGMCYLGGLSDPPALGGPPPAAGSSTMVHSRENDGGMQGLTLASDDLRLFAELTDFEDDRSDEGEGFCGDGGMLEAEFSDLEEE
ncbi:hypothetical protein FKP32DRAFT_1663038 [Trametes sanguinea]|nr:hypothetical protein FKP32DRAFT_1663038 [Trametes sanguinea]